MTDSILVEWEIDDGYCGGRRPQETEVFLEDFEVDMSDDDIAKEIEKHVEEDFKQRVYPEIDDIESFVSQVKEALRRLRDGE